MNLNDAYRAHYTALVKFHKASTEIQERSSDTTVGDIAAALNECTRTSGMVHALSDGEIEIAAELVDEDKFDHIACPETDDD